ncbi:MAG: TRAP transporter substrate-binding protein [Desulfoprunum sp.]|jgi:C4-dicarboxylate-binding protein DctP
MNKIKVMKKCLLLLVIVVMLPSISANGGDQSSQAPRKETMIRFSHGLPENTYISNQLKDWADLSMKENSGLKIQIYPSAQLFKDADAIEAVMTGSIESAQGYSFNLARIVPEMGIFDCPFLFDSSDMLAKVFNSSVRQRLDVELAKKNIKVLAYILWSVEQQGITSVKLLKVPADAKGMTSRVLGPESAALWKSWGMNPTFLSGSEVYMALQRGVIQSNLSSIMSNVERKYYEVAPYQTIFPLGVVVSTIFINKDFFDQLPEDQQQTMIDAGKKVESNSLARAKESNDEIFKQAEELKITIYRPNSEEMKLWKGDLEKLIQEIYKDSPQSLADIKEIQMMKH